MVTGAVVERNQRISVGTMLYTEALWSQRLLSIARYHTDVLAGRHSTRRAVGEALAFDLQTYWLLARQSA